MANQGGSHEQHVKAGQQSHKNSDTKTKSASSSSSSEKGGKQGMSDQTMKNGHKDKH